MLSRGQTPPKGTDAFLSVPDPWVEGQKTLVTKGMIVFVLRLIPFAPSRYPSDLLPALLGIKLL